MALPAYAQNFVPQDIQSITPSDVTALDLRGFMVTVAGDVEVTMISGGRGVYPGCVPGQMYCGAIVRIHEALTTATGIKGLK